MARRKSTVPANVLSFLAIVGFIWFFEWMIIRSL